MTDELEKLAPATLGRRIAEFRKAAGKTQEDTAKLLQMSRPTLVAMEEGTQRATAEEIVRLAKFFGRSVSELVRPSEPVQLEPHLRAAVAASGTSNDEVFDAIHQLQLFADDYRELERLTEARPVENFPPEVRLPAQRLAEFAEDVATRERSRLHLGDSPALELRKLLESSVGVRIFFLPVASKIAGLYAYVPDLGCCVLVNAKHPRERQRWTLAHEYGHFLADRHKPGVDYTTPGERTPANERFADAFAMCFLLPAAGVRQQYFDVMNSRGDFQVADLCRMASYYAVSLQAMTLRLESLGLVRQGTWALLAEQGFQPETARRDLNLESREPSPPAPYPARYKYLAAVAYCEGKLSEGQLARFLRTDRVSARRIIEECMTCPNDVGRHRHPPTCLHRESAREPGPRR